jgi:hypothetical protein
VPSLQSLNLNLFLIACALGGGLLGILASSPDPARAETQPAAENGGKLRRVRRLFLGGVSYLWSKRTTVMLLIVFVSAVALSLARTFDLRALAAASGGVLVGLLAPSPAHREREG